MDTSTHSKDDPGRFLCDTVERLLPLYKDDSVDRPENILSSYPSSARIIDGLEVLIDLVLPGRFSSDAIAMEDFSVFLMRRLSHAWRILRPELQRAVPFRWYGEAARVEGAPAPSCPSEASHEIIHAFMNRFPYIREMIIEDIIAAYNGDPAALNYAEVQLAYPGLLAVASHRIAHELYLLDVPIVPRVMSEWTHSRTGVDIHPGARVGRGLFIDHATGVVIGETTVIGNNVKLYQGVTLGAKSFPLDANGHPIKHIKRHPTVEDDVVIYAGATILGGETVIGKGTTIGANVFLHESVPPESLVTNQHPELKIKNANGH
ncbi:MAG: serine O-acetyltransferase [Kiritimatiellia bacterium]|jgi:serine O-acetyltransferase